LAIHHRDHAALISTNMRAYSINVLPEMRLKF